MSDDGTHAPRRAPSGVQGPPPPRWDPGARYRPSALAGRRDDAAPHGAAGRPAVPAVVRPAAHAPLPGRLYRGPARRTAVFDRDVWRALPDPPRPVAEALARAVERYRAGAIDTTGLVRAVGHALAA